jgi:hypothetical protein
MALTEFVQAPYPALDKDCLYERVDARRECVQGVQRTLTEHFQIGGGGAGDTSVYRAPDPPQFLREERAVLLVHQRVELLRTGFHVPVIVIEGCGRKLVQMKEDSILIEEWQDPRDRCVIVRWPFAYGGE